jgi:hypothetical protein
MLHGICSKYVYCMSWVVNMYTACYTQYDMALRFHDIDQTGGGRGKEKAKEKRQDMSTPFQKGSPFWEAVLYTDAQVCSVFLYMTQV